MSSSVNSKITIGCYPINPEPENAQLYSTYQIKGLLNKNQIQTLTTTLIQKIQKPRLPLITIQMPSSLKDIKINDILTQETWEIKSHQTQECFYHLCQLKDQQTRKFMKQIEKGFGKLNQLNNNMFINISFYDLDNLHKRLTTENKPSIVLATERMKIQFSLKTDENFIDKLKQLINAISPQFAESPIMGLLPLFQTIDAEINLDSFDCLQQGNLSKLFGKSKFAQPGEDQEVLKSALNSKELINIFISFGQLGIIQLSFQARLLAVYKCTKLIIEI